MNCEAVSRKSLEIFFRKYPKNFFGNVRQFFFRKLFLWKYLVIVTIIIGVTWDRGGVDEILEYFVYAFEKSVYSVFCSLTVAKENGTRNLHVLISEEPSKKFTISEDPGQLPISWRTLRKFTMSRDIRRFISDNIEKIRDQRRSSAIDSLGTPRKFTITGNLQWLIPEERRWNSQSSSCKRQFMGCVVCTEVRT